MNQETMTQNIKNLELARQKMELVDLASLDQAKKNQWAVSLNDLNQQINTLRAANLQSLSAEFQTEAPKLSSETNLLHTKLDHLNNATQIVDLVSASLKSITSLTRLLT